MLLNRFGKSAGRPGPRSAGAGRKDRPGMWSEFLAGAAAPPERRSEYLDGAAARKGRGLKICRGERPRRGKPRAPADTAHKSFDAHRYLV